MSSSVKSARPRLRVSRIRNWLNLLLDGIVDDDPRAKVRVVAAIYSIVACLNVMAAVLYRGPGWILFGASRFVALLALAAFLWRRNGVRSWESVIYLGVLPAALFVTQTRQHAVPVEVGVAFTFVAPTLAAILYSRRIALTSALCEYLALVWFAVSYNAPDAALADMVGFGAVFALLVAILNGTAVRLRTAVTELRAAQAHRDRVQLAVDQATELERARIATELHDDTIQVMTAASLKLDVAKARRADGGQLDEALELMQQAISRARRLSFDLYPPSLDDGLSPAFQEMGARAERDGGATVTVSACTGRYPAEVERLVYRTAKELLENARRHAHAGVIVLSVRPADGDVSLEVMDDGVGFDGAAAAADGDFHFGLRAADERVRRAGGVLTIDSTIGHGTRALMWLPSAEEHAVTEDGDRGLLRSERPMEPPA